MDLKLLSFFKRFCFYPLFWQNPVPCNPHPLENSLARDKGNPILPSQVPLHDSFYCSADP